MSAAEMSAADAATGPDHPLPDVPLPDVPVRESTQGTWFRLPDGTPGSRLRLPAGTAAAGVRRLRRLGLPGLLPVAAVLEHDGRLWVDTPLPPGPTVEDLLGTGRRLGLGAGDATAVLGAVGRALRALHARGLGHGALDPTAVLIAPDGAPVLVALTGGSGSRDRDLAAWARLAWTLADAWCGSEPGAAGAVRGCADLAEAAGLGAALGALPAASDGDGRRRAVRAWTEAGNA
jgi:hypothetical protein